MNLRRTLATAGRLASQLRHDHRTVAMLLLLPSLLLILLRFVFDGNARLFDQVGGAMLAVFPFVTMFLVTSIVTLRERTSGTLERLLVLPFGKLDLILGYALTFSLIALVQVTIATLVSTQLLGLDIAGALPWLLVVATLDAILGVALGLFVSAFARTEFQAVQFMPLFVLPQVLLCGLLTPRAMMQPLLYDVSKVLPLSYAIDAINRVVRVPTVDGVFYRNLIIIAIVAMLFLLLGAITLRRKS